MKKRLQAFAFLAATAFAAGAPAQVNTNQNFGAGPTTLPAVGQPAPPSGPSISNTQTIAPPGSTVITTIQSPDEVTTRVTTAPGQSVITHLKSGMKIEMDSDGSVYQVFADGARAAAPDGIQTLIDGTTITIKNGRRIP